DLVERGEVSLYERARQTPLVNDTHSDAFGTPVDRSNRLHAVKLAARRRHWERSRPILRHCSLTRPTDPLDARALCARPVRDDPESSDRETPGALAPRACDSQSFGACLATIRRPRRS